MFDFKKLFDLKYIFNSNPGYEFKFAIPALIILSVMLAGAILISWRLRRKNLLEIKASIVRLLSTISIIGLFLLFFRTQGIIFFSVRFLWIILFLISLIWTARILWYIFKVMPRKNKEDDKRYEFEKYLPAKNRKHQL